jgi:outer membrane receptor protein involved in Fe transport
MYNPITGQQQLWDWDAASKTWGVFAQDTWKARNNLTLTLGLRFDNQGNPYSRSDSTVFGNFLLGSGSTFEQQVASGVASPSENALNGSPKVWNPRLGAAWDVNGKGDWVERGGLGCTPIG